MKNEASHCSPPRGVGLYIFPLMNESTDESNLPRCKPLLRYCIQGAIQGEVCTLGDSIPLDA